MTIDEWKTILRNTEQTVEAYQEVDQNYRAYVNSLNEAEKKQFLADGGWSIGEMIFMMLSALESVQKNNDGIREG